ncbi:hypothetical protein JRO89_XS03G0237300 [Xanthoceras sorbifolium]|uniref:NAD(P)-binding domain-containing protein n=1 Tax=Xanthoceras sorbifolium TaxID=99658 RepID=A0ABQ8ICL0_9ROSI|nr:hypothetical protein JRO89_XS03G0237300 [Xanthoceras sorbifolium]
MKSVVSRLIHSRSSLSELHAIVTSRSGRYLSTDSNKVDEPFKVEEAETINVPPPPTDKLLVLGGNGFVGSHILREALDRGVVVASLSRSGRSSLHDSWANNITWHQGNLLTPDSWKEAFNGVTSVISCVGGFGSNSYMYKINGTANINAIRVASEKGIYAWILSTEGVIYLADVMFYFLGNFLESFLQNKVWLHVFCINTTCSPISSVSNASNSIITCYSIIKSFPCASDRYHGMYDDEVDFSLNAIELFFFFFTFSSMIVPLPTGVKRFVYISAADFGVANYLLRGFYEGKKAAETELLTKFPYGGVILRPGFIYGTRTVGSVKLPLGVVGSPLEMVNCLCFLHIYIFSIYTGAIEKIEKRFKLEYNCHVSHVDQPIFVPLAEDFFIFLAWFSLGISFFCTYKTSFQMLLAEKMRVQSWFDNSFYCYGYFEVKACSRKQLKHVMKLMPGESFDLPNSYSKSLQVLQHAKPLNQLPLVGPLFTPPVNVTAVAKVALRAATDPVFPPGIVDVHGILRYSQQRSR